MEAFSQLWFLPFRYVSVCVKLTKPNQLMGQRHTDTQGKRPYEDKDRYWSNVSTNQGRPVVARKRQGLANVEKAAFLEPLVGTWFSVILNFWPTDLG